MNTAVQNANENINLIECDTYEDLMARSATCQMSSGVMTAPGTLYMQGGRYCFSTAFSLPALTQITVTKRPGKSKSGVTSIGMVKDSTNRPLDPAHAKAISKYVGNALLGGSPYILPSITLNLGHPVDVLAVKGSADARAAVLSLPLGTHMEITDGQHRVEGVKKLLEAGDFDMQINDGVSVMITFTSKVAQVHQDFADCSKTKAINASVLAVYDRRNPANGLVADLVERSPVFSFTVDSTKASVSKRSVTVWTTNQIRVLLKWAFIGAQSSDEVFQDNAVKILGDSDSQEYHRFLEDILSALDTMTRVNPALRRIAALGPDQLDQVPKIREEEDSMLLSGSGLAVFGCLCNKLRTARMDGTFPDSDAVVQQIATLDWRNTSQFFSNNLKSNPERTQSGQKYVKAAAYEMWDYLYDVVR